MEETPIQALQGAKLKKKNRVYVTWTNRPLLLSFEGYKYTVHAIPCEHQVST